MCIRDSIKGVCIQPFILTPYFNAAAHTYQYSILLDSGKLPKNSRKENPSLLVYFTCLLYTSRCV